MSQLWVQYNTTTGQIFGPIRVTIQGFEYVDDFLKEIKKESQLAIPQNTPISLFQPDGTTQIKPIDTIDSLGNMGTDDNSPLIAKPVSFALTTGPSAIKSPLIGQALSVCINQSKLIKKYLTPVGSTSSNPIEASPISVDISSLGVQWEPLMFCENTTTKPCIVIDVQQRPLEQLPEEPPTITIVLITGFGGMTLNEVMAEEEFQRVMPIHPTASLPGTATPINTTPEWMTHSKHKVPSYILCIPIKVYPHNLRKLEPHFQLDKQNLQKLKSHILALGEIKANADYVDLEEDDSDESDDDDDIELSSGYFNRIVSWDEIDL